MARTKLVCTLGPASATPKMIQGLARAGEPVPSTFSEPSLPAYPADDEARRVTAAVSDILWG